MNRGIGRIAVAISLTLMFSGCQSETSVTVIKGPGSSNNSKMIGFNELCAGSVEGFVGDSLLISRIDGDKINFFSVDHSTKEEESVFQTLWYKDFYQEISKDKLFFLYENKLVDIKNKTFSTLPYIEIKGTSQMTGKSIPNYSFYGEHEVLYSNPIHYIKKYISKSLIGSKTIFLSKYGMDVSKTKDNSRKDKNSNFDFSSIDLPDLSSIESPILDVDNMKYYFIGQHKETNKKSFYVLDLFDKKFSMIDSDVKGISLSPDFKKMAYIKDDSSKKSEDSIIVADSSGNQKSVIKVLREIKTLSWSEDASWIAFSGGEKDKNDIYIVKYDGTNEEQLTQGMNTEGRISWSRNGDKIAFGISDSEKNNKRVYIIKLGIKSQEGFKIRSEVSKEKQDNAILLLEIIRRESDEIIKNFSNQN